MAKITFINSKGMELVATTTIPFLLINKDGITKGSNYNINSTKSLGQDGETPNSYSFKVRDLDYDFEISATNIQELKLNTEKVLMVFNPKLSPGILVYQEGNIKRYIKVMLDGTPTFMKGTAGYCKKVKISMTAYSPFWYEEEEKFLIGGIDKKLKFPIIIPSTKMELGTKEDSLIFNALNRGHLDTGMRIEFLATRGTVGNPSIINVNSQKYMKINRTLQLGEKIVITTDYDNKNIMSILNGTETKVVKDIDVNSKFIQLEIGDNLFRYNAERNIENLEVNVYYTPKFLGV